MKKLIEFEGREYFGIREFDCRVVSLFTEPTLQGTFLTVIPISDLEYRKRNPTKAKVIINKNKHYTIFKMYSDWGGCSIIKIHNSLSEEINFAVNKAKEQELLENDYSL